MAANRGSESSEEVSQLRRVARDERHLGGEVNTKTHNHKRRQGQCSLPPLAFTCSKIVRQDANEISTLPEKLPDFCRENAQLLCRTWAITHEKFRSLTSGRFSPLQSTCQNGRVLPANFTRVVARLLCRTCPTSLQKFFLIFTRQCKQLFCCDYFSRLLIVCLVFISYLCQRK